MEINYNSEGEPVLGEREVAKIKGIMLAISMIHKEVKSPIDPKVETALEIAFECLKEQLALDKAYTWGEIAQEDDRFLEDDDNILSEEELWKMFEGDKNEPPMSGAE